MRQHWRTHVGAGATWEGPLFLLALAGDLVLGEPPARLHPVVWMGRIAEALERRAPDTDKRAQLAYGALLALAPPAIYAALTAMLSRALRQRSQVAALLAGAALFKTTFAVRELRRAAEQVRRALVAGDLPAARDGLRALVSRDTSGFDAPLIAAAAVESLAENFSDAIVAPFLAYALWGVPGAVAYRAVNTLDAMIGYHGRYEWLGKPAARLDDLVNLAPARLAAGLLLLAAAGGSGDPHAAWQTMWRDAGKTASPNAGWPMAAMAGALGVALEKPGHYRLGGEFPPPTAATIARADRLVVAAMAAGALLAVVARGRGTAN